MAKFSTEFPGNSLNLKLTLTDLDGKTISDDKIGQFAAGVLKYTRDYLCFYAPNVNSYKRLYEDDIYNCWNKIGNSSDIKGVNIINENHTKKIHFAVPGADANPYLVLFALIESGKLGIEETLLTSNVEKGLKDLEIPTSLNKANKIFKLSEATKKSLGEEFHYHYNAFYSYEYESFNNQISLWELERYLYSI
jgi:glutamine synthetase